MVSTDCGDLKPTSSKVATNHWLSVYDDGGISGGHVERPALQALLNDISRKLIDVVVIYKVDRLKKGYSMDWYKQQQLLGIPTQPTKDKTEPLKLAKESVARIKVFQLEMRELSLLFNDLKSLNQLNSLTNLSLRRRPPVGDKTVWRRLLGKHLGLFTERHIHVEERSLNKFS